MSIIEKSFQVGDPAQDDQALKGIFRMIRRDNLAINGDFSMGMTWPNQDVDLQGGTPASGDALLSVPGWRVGIGTVDTTGAAIPVLINYAEPDKGWHNELSIVTAGQYLPYICDRWAGYEGTLFGLSKAGPGAGGYPTLYLTVVMEVFNEATSPGTLTAEIQGFGTTLSSLFTVTELARQDLTLAPGTGGKVYLVVKIVPNAGVISTPITGPAFKFTFNSAGSYKYDLKRFAIYDGAFPFDYLPEYSAGNEAVDKYFAELFSARSSYRMSVKKAFAPLVVATPPGFSANGYIWIPFQTNPGPMSPSKGGGLPSPSDIQVVVDDSLLFAKDDANSVGASPGFSFVVSGATVTVTPVAVTPQGVSCGVSVTGYAGPLYLSQAFLDLTLSWRRIV